MSKRKLASLYERMQQALADAADAQAMGQRALIRARQYAQVIGDELEDLDPKEPATGKVVDFLTRKAA